MDFAGLLHALPKAELHCHLEGSIPALTIVELARGNGVPLPTYDPERLYRVGVNRDEFLRTMAEVPRWILQGFARKYQRPVDSPEDLYALGVYEAFLERFDDVCAVMVTADDFSRATYDALSLAAKSNVRYREMFFHPMNHPGVSYRTMLDGLLDGIRAAEADHGVVARLIPAINRDHSAAAAVAFAEEVVARRVPEVVGFASDYDEEHLPAFVEAYRIAGKAGLPGTAHAGEYGSAKTVAECVDLLGCKRVDHGYSVIDDAELTARLAEERIHFTAIFSWSVAISHPEQLPLDPPTVPPARRVDSPVSEMLDRGLSVSLNSDDPVFEGFASLAGEYLWAAGHLDLDAERMAELSLAAVDASWQDDGAKAAMRRDFEQQITALMVEAARQDSS
jgi:adenosine deaminase